MTEKPDFMKLIEEYFEKNKPPTLKERFVEWYDTANMCQSKDVIANELCNIVKEWLPKESGGSIDVLQWNKCVRRMKETLR
jgi:hypothetical protein